MAFTLYNAPQSTCSQRVRFVLNAKKLSFVEIKLDLLAGDQFKPDYLALNPNGVVPTLDHAGAIVIDSSVIIEYLDEIAPEPPLLPKDPIARAQVRGLADIVACDIHPMNNLGSLRYLKHELHQEQPAIDAWYHHWVVDGFTALETLVQAGPYSFGADVTLADVFLVPQVANARRLKVPLDAFPKIVGIEAACLKLSTFDRARPENQPDAE